jgi:hypothetical protein
LPVVSRYTAVLREDAIRNVCFPKVAMMDEPCRMVRLDG